MHMKRACIAFSLGVLGILHTFGVRLPQRRADFAQYWRQKDF
jgi:hypothetical protein